jgi:hypothetical protein
MGLVSYTTWDYNENNIASIQFSHYYAHYLHEVEKCTPTAYLRPYGGRCSNRVFQSYFNVCKKLPEFGNWTNIAGYKHGQAVFSTPLCKVQNVSGELLAEQLKGTHIDRILMIGDSHGFRYFTALKKLVSSSGYDCEMVLQEEGDQRGPKHMPHYLAKNWGISEKALTRKHRGCYSCRCNLVRCKHRSSRHTIELEFLGMVISSNFILPDRKVCSKANYTFCAARTEKELIFKYYLAERRPDVVMISTTSSHDYKTVKGKPIRPTLKQVLPHYVALKSLVEGLNPKVTMWITTVYQRHSPSLNNDITAFNKALFKLLEKELTGAAKSPSLTMIGFDHTAIARPLSGVKWSKDAVHYHPVFYMEAINHLMNQFCTMRSVE